MAVWLAAPSARDNAGTFPLWRQAGYKLCVWRDPGASAIEADHVITGEWRGVYFAINRCMEWAFANDQECDWCVFAGDDTMPDPSESPDQIAAECTAHFGGSLGVMQPCSDRWGDRQGAYIDRVAGSPWIGRNFAARAYQGHGPFWEEYVHQFGDQDLWCVAHKLGIYWARHDIGHFHSHWGRPSPGQTMGLHSNMPAFLREANSLEHWAKYKRLFETRRHAGFPGHDLLI